MVLSPTAGDGDDVPMVSRRASRLPSGIGTSLVGNGSDHSAAQLAHSGRRLSAASNVTLTSLPSKRRGSISSKPSNVSHVVSSSTGKGNNKINYTTGNANFAKAMDVSAKKITAAVHSLYKHNREDDYSDAHSHDGTQASPEEGERRRGSKISHIGVSSEKDKGGGSDSSKQSDSDSDSDDMNMKKSKNRPADDDDDSQSDDDDDYDFKQAAMKVTTLLDSLNCDARCDLMSSLNTFYTNRRGTVEDDLKEIGTIEDDFSIREEENKHSMHGMLQSFEEKQMREVKVLVKCNKTLHLGAAGKLKQRRRFAKQASRTSRSSVKSDRSRKKKTSFTESRSNRSNAHGDHEGEGDDNEESSSSDESASTEEEKHSEADQEPGEPAQEQPKDAPTEPQEADAGHASQQPPGVEAEVEKKTKEDGLDIDAAKRKLKEMHDIPPRVLVLVNQQNPPAADILNALAKVQDGQLHLEEQAKLAKKSCEISKAAVEHLFDGTADPTPAMLELIAQIKLSIFGEHGEQQANMGPDPEELEEECKTLEALISKQEREIDMLYKQRERSTKLEQEMNDNGKDDDARSDGSEEQAPVLLKSELRDGRIEAAQSSKPGEPARAGLPVALPSPNATAGKAAFGRVKTAMKVQNIVGKLGVSPNTPNNKQSPTADGQGPASPGAVAPSWQSNRQVQLLQDTINEQQVKIRRAREVHKRMKKEYALLRYCARMSEAGLEAILENYNPSDAGGDSESSADSDDENKKKLKRSDSTASRKKTMIDGEASVIHAVSEPADLSPKLDKSPSQPTLKQRSESAPSGSEGDEVSPKSRSSVVQRKKSLKRSNTANSMDGRPRNTKRQSTAPSLGLSEPPEEENRRMDAKDFQGQVASFNTRKLEEAEADIKNRINDLNVEIARDVHMIKTEKKRQAALKKEIKQMKKKYAATAKQQKNIPSSLEALDKQMGILGEAETKIRTQIDELREELTKQMRLLEKAQQEAKENEERRKAEHDEQRKQASTMRAASKVRVGEPEGATTKSLVESPRQSGMVNSAESLKSSAETSASAVVGGGANVAAQSQPAQVKPATPSSVGRSEVPPQPAQAQPASEVTATSGPGESSRKDSKPGSQPAHEVAGKSPSKEKPPSNEAAQTLPSNEVSGKNPSKEVSREITIASQDNSTDVHDPQQTPHLAVPASEQVPTPLASAPVRPSLVKVHTSPSLPSDVNASNQTADSENKEGDKSAAAAKRGPLRKSNSSAAVAQETPASAVSHEDLAELVRLQSRNEDLKNEIDEMMRKMQQLRAAMKRGKGTGLDNDTIRQIVGEPANKEDAKPPPEYTAMKREVRTKQNEVRSLRKRWWIDHKDLDIIAEKVKHNVQAEYDQNLNQSYGDPRFSSIGDFEMKRGTGEPQGELHRRSTGVAAPVDKAAISSTVDEVVSRRSSAGWGQEKSVAQNEPGWSNEKPEFGSLRRGIRRAKTDNLNALMASTTGNQDKQENTGSRGRKSWAARAAAVAATLPQDQQEEGTSSMDMGVIGHFHGVRKSLKLPAHSLAQLIGDEQVDVHDRTQPEYTKKDSEGHDYANYKPEFDRRRHTQGSIMSHADSTKSQSDSFKKTNSEKSQGSDLSPSAARRSVL